MLMLNSAEFVALCRAQVVLLTQAFGASLSVVYLTQELADGTETQLIPIVAYPETAVDWQAQGITRSLTAAIDTAKPAPWLLAAPPQPPSPPKHLPAAISSEATLQAADSTVDRCLDDCEPHDRSEIYSQPNRSRSNYAQSNHREADRTALVPERRIVLPLMHEDVVLGLLVTERSDRPWTEFEQAQIHQIADTLAIARVLDQRHQWLEHDQRRQLQAQQHDLLDNLLHQFRNSLTTLQTFGKLILKRLLPDDANRDIAASLVRETVRLRDLAQQLELAVGSTEALQTPPLALPAPDARSQPRDDQPFEPLTTDTQPPAVPPLPLLPAAGFLSSTTVLLEPCSLPTVLEPLLASAHAIAQERALILLTDIPTDLPLVSANVQLLQEVLSNAIDNALKYTPAGGQVLVQASVKEGSGQRADFGVSAQSNEGRLRRERSVERGQTVEIAVTDTGPGIPSEDLPHIFERRYRGVQAQTDIPGSGLGLAIARALVTQMQGEIDVFSPAQVNAVDPVTTPALTPQGQGTTVVVRLAIGRLAIAPEAQKK